MKTSRNDKVKFFDHQIRVTLFQTNLNSRAFRLARFTPLMPATRHLADGMPNNTKAFLT